MTAKYERRPFSSVAAGHEYSWTSILLKKKGMKPYPVDANSGHESYAGDIGERAYKDDRYARRSTGDEYYAQNVGGYQVYRKDPVTKDEIYAKNHHGDQFYAKDSGTNTSNEHLARMASGPHYYAVDRYGNEIYPEEHPKKQFYRLSRLGNQIYAKYNKAHSQINEYFLRDDKGNEVYAKRINDEEIYPVDSHGNQRYARDSSGKANYPVKLRDYARDMFGDPVYNVDKNEREIVRGTAYATDEDGDEVYPDDEHGNKVCIKNAKGEHVFAKTADNRYYYPFSYQGYEMMPRTSSGDVLKHAQDSRDTADIELKPMNVNYLLSSVVSPHGRLDIGTPERHWSWQSLLLCIETVVILMFVAVFSVRRYFY